MFNLFRFANKTIHHMTWVDMGVAKFDLIVVGLLLAKLFPVLTSFHWWRYVGIIVLCEIYFIRMISKIK